MFGVPKTTEIRKSVPKKMLYTKYASELKGDKKTQFDNDISRIVITNEISPASVNIKNGTTVNAIFVVQIDLKVKEYNTRDIVLISRLFGQNLLLVLKYEEEYQLAIYQTKMLCSEWKNETDIDLNLNGLDLDSVWENLVSQVSGIVAEQGNSLDEQIAIEGEKTKIKKQIEDLDKKSRRETQAKKKFEMFQQIKELQKKLEGM